MGTCDALHKKFVTFPISGLTILGLVDNSFDKKPVEFIHQFVDIYNEKINENSGNKELYEALRILLCYEYQLKFDKKLESTICYSNKNLSKNLINNLLNCENNDEHTNLIIFDITILQIVLYLNLNQIKNLFDKIFELKIKLINESKNFDNYYKIIEIIIDAINLKNKYSNFNNEELMKEINLLLLKEINNWFEIIEENQSQEWRSFTSFLLKIISSDSPEIISNLWELILKYESQNSDKKYLSLLCGCIEDFFSKKSEEITLINLNYCNNKKILKLICDNLTSTIQFYRKQSQYILKNIINYSEKNFQKLQIELIPKKLILPFIFCKESNKQEIEKKYFLLLESLEEKQAHLVLPAMSHLEDLIKINISHKSCNNCFHQNWLRCIFTRLLHHENNIIIKTGLSTLLRLDLEILDDFFIELLIVTLNNTFLYDDQNSDPCPQIFQEISQLFINPKISESNFLQKFIVIASKVTWSPIPLFYLFEALGNNEKLLEMKHSPWKSQELEAVRIIIEKNLRLQTKIMQIQTQTNIIKLITIFVEPPVDLMIIGKIIASFPSENVLERGKDTWKLFTEYLKKNIDEETAVKFVSNNCEKLLNETENSNVNVVAILIVFLYDTEKIFIKKSCSALNSLQKLFTPLIGLDKRPYADLKICFKSLKMINYLLKLSPKSKDIHFQLIQVFIESVLNLILKSLKTLPQSFDDAKIYLDVFSAIIYVQDLIPDKSRIFNNFFNGYREKGLPININNNSAISSWYLLNILCLCNQSSNSVFSEIPADFEITNSDGKIVSECYGLIAKINYQMIKFNEILSDDFYAELLNKKLVILAERKSDNAIPWIAECLQEIIEKLNNKKELIANCSINVKNIIDICWKNAWDMKRTEFRISVGKLTKLIINKYFLKINDFKEIALNYVEEILTKSENIPSLRYILFSRMNSLEENEIFIFHDLIINSIIHTISGRIDKRVEMQTTSYIIKNNKINYFDENFIWGLGIYADVIVRCQLIKLILKMISWNSEKIGNNCVPQLIKILQKNKNKRYFGDSNLHKIKHRIMQILLLLQPYLNDINIKNIHDTLIDLIIGESNQPSVRLMQEWILIKIYFEKKNMRDFIWNFFALARENRPGSVTSLVSIVYHVSKLLPNDEKLDYIKKALENILPSCLSQQFIVRLYSQVILSKLFEMINEFSHEYKMIEEAVTESLRYGNLMTNSIKLFDNFYFSIFDPILDYDLQTIFHDLPRLTNVSVNEWISPELFNKIVNNSVKLINIENREKLCGVEIWEISKEANETHDDVENNEALVDIQKKIIPQNSESTIPITLRQKLITNDTGLIVIASLIEGFPNLGGLARTAEIFCARELILKSKKYIENKEFQSLSVSAEKWITISEVKPHELRDYLLEKKEMGWNLIGAEQTANSVNLLDMKFEDKTVLLLGNEKNGIPANLIQLMDVCVEIPQAGVVRSLNVHVTGAICMWQYAKQHIFVR